MLLRHGIGLPLTVLVLPALFEEANRMRRFTVSLMRALAMRGIGSILPDLPGTGESLRPLSEVSLDDWREVVSTLASNLRQDQGQCLTVAIRGGAILDTTADHGWRLVPETGERVLRDMVRATALSSTTTATEIDRRARVEPTLLAGQTLSPALYCQLAAATLSSSGRRTARPVEDIGTRDEALVGTRLWRNAEPGDDPEFVLACVNSIENWSATCAIH
ncbi:hypothetical protein [Sphingomonas sp.]|uniref:hypothetical protein n=1 Tax=Sphingomonas sp. TaxID=28214 RepID=UPI0025F7A540|nr:hypothetical protein [Sphingomonas sp.]